MNSEDRFLNTLGDYLEGLPGRWVRPGAEQRVVGAVATAAHPATRGAGWASGRPLRVGLVVALASLVVVGGQSYLSQRSGPASLGKVALMVAIQPAGASLDCRLPISALSEDHTTGFINLRAGGSTFDPVKTSGTTYVASLGRWVDTLPQMVSPDGRSYLYDDNTPQGSTLHLIDAHGDRVLPKTAPFVSAFAFTPSGILLLDSTANGQGGPEGLLVFKMMDPTTGAVRSLPIPPLHASQPHAVGASSETGYVRSGDAVWTTSYSSDSRVSVLWRYDLGTGAMVEWYNGASDGPGNLQVVGGDSRGKPIIQVSSTDLFHTDPAKRNGISEKTLRLSGPHQTETMNQGRVGDPGTAGNLSPLSVTQGDRVWMASDDGQVWLYRPAAGMQLVAKVSTGTKGAPGVAISGPCA